MAIEFAPVLFELVKKIVFQAIATRVNYHVEPFFTKRKIESRLENSIAQVIEQLLPFFENERIAESKRGLLLEICRIELSALLENPQEFFASSLDGQKIFDRRYASGGLPEAIREEGLSDSYAQIFPQIANLVCMYPPTVELWRIEGYKDYFRRLDDMTEILGKVANKLDSIALREIHTTDVLLKRVRQSLIQRVEFQLDLTDLRGDRPDAVPLEKCFIVPEFSKQLDNLSLEKQKEIKIGTESDIAHEFTRPFGRVLVIGPAGAGKSTWSQ